MRRRSFGIDPILSSAVCSDQWLDENPNYFDQGSVLLEKKSKFLLTSEEDKAEGRKISYFFILIFVIILICLIYKILECVTKTEIFFRNWTENIF